MLKLSMTKTSWVVSGTVAGQRIRKALKGIPPRKEYKADAQRALMELERAAFSGTGAKQFTFDECAQHYETFKRREGRSMDGITPYVTRLIAAFGKRSASSITALDATMYANDLGRVQAGTIRRHLVALKAILNHANKHGMLDVVPRIELPRVDDARDQHLEIDEIDAVLAWVKTNRSAHYMALTMLIDTGLRLNELLRLQWRDVATDKIVVQRVSHGKAKTRTVPLSKRAQAALAGCGATSFVGSVVLNASGGAYKDRHDAARRWRSALWAACDALKIPRLRLHDLRHTFAYQAATHGADLGDLQGMMGHANVSMTMRYRGFIPNRAQAIIQDFGRILPSDTKTQPKRKEESLESLAVIGRRDWTRTNDPHHVKTEDDDTLSE